MEWSSCGQVVAVDHVPSPVGTEVDQQPHGFALADVDHVLGALLVRERGPAVAAEDLEVHQMHVHGMEPAARAVLQLPDFHGVQGRIGHHPLNRWR